MSDFLKAALAEIKRRKGVDLSGYRSVTLQSILEDRLRELQCDEPAAYIDRLQNDPVECDSLLSAFSINVSRFFRNPAMYEVLANRVLPEIIKRKRAARGREIRVWSVGCAEGEEPYSVAILIHEALKAARKAWTTHIFATDIDEGALGRASIAQYPRERLTDTKLGVLDAYFEPRGDGFALAPIIRDMVCFSKEDFASEKTKAPTQSVFGTFDLALCRNVLIYFDLELQRKAMRKLADALDRGGILILGESEFLTPELAAQFETVDEENRIYRKSARRKI